MNRELRRAQQKAEEKQQKEKVRARQAKREKREEIVARRRNRKSSARKTTEADKSARRRDPGRFSSVLTIFTTVFIIMQGILPTPEGQAPLLSYVVETLYYLMFSYFGVLWAARSGFQQPLYISIGAGLGLTAALLVAQFAVPSLTPNLIQAALAVPAVVLGTFGGRLVWNRA